MKPIIAFALLPILLSYCTPKMEVNPYTRTSTLPIPCRNPIGTDQANDPQYNFEVFMATVKEHYAQSSILSLHSHHLE